MKKLLIVVLCLAVSGCSFLDRSTKVGIYDQEDHLMVEAGEVMVCPRDGQYISEAGTEMIDTSQGKQIYLPRYDSVTKCSAGEIVKCAFSGEFWSDYYAETVVGVKIKDRR